MAIPNWLTLSQTAGTGNATVTVTASSYSELVERSAALIISGQNASTNLNLFQDYVPSLSASPLSLSFEKSGGTATFMISSNIDWSIDSYDEWLSFSALSGHGDATITVTASTNTYVARSSSIVITGSRGGLMVNLFANQEGVTLITITPELVSFPNSGKTLPITITCDGEWTITPPSFVTASPLTGSGNTTVYLTTDVNPNLPISSTLSASSIDYTATCSVFQEGGYVPPSGSTNPESITVAYRRTEIDVEIETNVDWYLEKDNNWVSYNIASGHSGTTHIIVTINENADLVNSRSSEIRLKYMEDGRVLYYLPILQLRARENNSSTPLTIEMLESGSLRFETSEEDTYASKKNDGSWSTMNNTGRTFNNLVAGDRISFKLIGSESSDYYPLHIASGTSTTKHEAYGNAFSLARLDYSAVTSASTYESSWRSIGIIFQKDQGLINASDVLLPPQTIERDSGYTHMFFSCPNLEYGPELPATSITGWCYSSMFTDNLKLKEAPALPALKLYDRSYEFMFCGCWDLKRAPVLYGQGSYTDGGGPYLQFVKYCSKLNYIKCFSPKGGSDWVLGVSGSGTFVTSRSINWPIGDNGIPSGWVVEYTEGYFDSVPQKMPMSGSVIIGIDAEKNWTLEVDYGNNEIDTYFGTPATTSIMFATRPNTGYSARDVFLKLYIDNEIADIKLLQQDVYPIGSITYGGSMTIPHTGATLSAVLNTNVPWLFEVVTNGSRIYSDVDYSYPATNEREDFTIPANTGEDRTVILSLRDEAETVYLDRIDITQKGYPSGTITYTGGSIAQSGETIAVTVSASSSWVLTTVAGSTTLTNSGDSGTTVVSLPIPSNAGAGRYISLSLNVDGVVADTKEIKQNGDATIDYLTFDFTGDGDIRIYGLDAYNALSYRINGGSWIAATSAVSVTSGDSVEMKATKRDQKSGQIKFRPTAPHTVSGNVLSVVTTDWTGNTSTYSSSWPDSSYMFMEDVNLQSAENLVLPSTTLMDNCYSDMFYGCTSLTTAPTLPATTLASSCYEEMFDGCTSLSAAPSLPVTALTTSCYQNMFGGCTSLTAAPTLPATTLANNCYRGMFNNCTGLTSAPALPATTLAKACYEFMFDNCTSLSAAPELPATTLVDDCYSYMFLGCTSLTSAPVLSATTLADYCCIEMFSGCTNLNNIKCLATSFGYHSTIGWVDGVAATGTFTKAAGVGWSSGVDGIPNGWTVIEE